MFAISSDKQFHNTSLHNSKAEPVLTQGNEPPEKLRVLCIDDDEIVLFAAQALLGKRFEVRIARSGAEGLAELNSFKPDWVVVDYQMPEMDGARFMLEARSLGQNCSYILLTGVRVGLLDWEGLSPLGLKGFLKKPLDVNELIPIIEGKG